MWPHDRDATQERPGHLIPDSQRGENSDQAEGRYGHDESRDGKRMLWVDICRRVPWSAIGCFPRRQLESVVCGVERHAWPRIAEATRQPQR